jgi:hypothetical protein
MSRGVIQFNGLNMITHDMFNSNDVTMMRIRVPEKADKKPVGAIQTQTRIIGLC